MTLVSVVVIAITTGCGGSPAPTTETTTKADEPGLIIADEPLTDVDQSLRDEESSLRRVTYVSRSGVNDADTHVTASIFVPRSTSPEGGFPIVAFGHQTTGTLRECAPSLSPTLLNSAPTVVALLKAGYVVAVPDYRGLGIPSDGTHIYHLYLDSTTAGYNMIDDARARRWCRRASNTGRRLAPGKADKLRGQPTNWPTTTGMT